ncbi:hypothetical protein A3J19_00180 [Candidatus Daviesbacteria bacterium RIFCSPLOWO2_02_FULL_41_8]|uniref:Uncharacterized protein n=3 Tax=Candidatus Daviesiibacteriota TaxID=1752718 RepID=A0A1F5NM63_9BACT|nr:MAG: hypothetical protein A2871_01395 [Candidatus Daviesbacteria bacterium RIFCSPHIGHO2_01_FULL_41_23]OGE32781.1 MAG: hypothetical protein A3D83_03060 [Candidatus Daviesbacteria bacterium RIFCSPHIGHO2_02_FULL_41_10]OGE62123.1 MAG: hypothetical protein A2967_00490 [Candidatus Daviesbacteria bacterium RIFCSPLOWO2_01_FULL_41_32]OGE78604.1 MAG: hypothetical protein A3J19_00180 [Candidatus Daviesbacteria bacterium RIFCSPLOWO2_02_FULL_41_8]
MSAEKLFSIDDAKQLLLDLGICADVSEADEAIRHSREQYRAIVPDDVYAAFCVVVNRASIDLEIGERFQKRFQAPYNWTNLRNMAFGGFNIDSQRANLPDIES